MRIAILSFAWLGLLGAGSMHPTAHADDKAKPPVTFATSPRQLPYYDVKRLQGLTLQDMNLKVLSRDKFEGTEIIAVTYDAFDQPVAGPSGLITVRWRQRATLVLPSALATQGKALAFSIHDAEAGAKDHPRSFLGMSISVAKAFGIPVLVHSWQPDVVKQVDGGIYHDTQDKTLRRLLAAKIEAAADLPMDGRYLYNGNPLAKSDMVSLTLLQRLVERERGVKVTQIASMGGSKEGHSHWVLGAIDDRVTVLAPGGMYWHDSNEFLDRYAKDWGFRFPWQGSDADLRSLFETVWLVADWVRSTEAGQLVAHTTIDPSTWYQEIRAKHVVVFGDLGITPGQHDGPWPFWAENKPLSGFAHPSWRYLRLFDGSGAFMDEEGVGEMGMSLLPQMADLLVNDAVSPSTPVASTQEIGERQVSVTASAQVKAGVHSEALALYAISPERGLRSREYWHTAVLSEVKDVSGQRSWRGDLPVVPSGQGLAIIIVVRERIQVGELTYWRSASSLPIERFPVPELQVAKPSWRQ